MKATIITILGLFTILIVGCATLKNDRETVYWFPTVISQDEELQRKIRLFISSLYEELKFGYDKTTTSIRYSGKKGSYYEGITVWVTGPESINTIGISYSVDIENSESVETVKALFEDIIGEKFLKYSKVKEVEKSHRQ
jgi:hypothetical protein